MTTDLQLRALPNGYRWRIEAQYSHGWFQDYHVILEKDSAHPLLKYLGISKWEEVYTEYKTWYFNETIRRAMGLTAKSVKEMLEDAAQQAYHTSMQPVKDYSGIYQPRLDSPTDKE